MSRANFVQVRLAAAATDIQKTLTIKAPEGGLKLPPADGGRLVLTDSPGRPSAFEIITYTGRTGSGPYTLTGVTRGVEGTVGLTWAVDTFVMMTLTVGEFEGLLDLKADKTVQIAAGTGLGGGGNLSADRTLSVKYGTTAGTAAQGNDSRLSNSREWTASAVSQAEAEAGTATTARKWTAQRVRQAIAAFAAPFSRKVIAGTGLEGGGDLSADRTLSVKYGTAAGTAAQGNDSRLSNSREWTATTVSQAEAEAGTATTARKWTSQRVAQAISALGLKIGTTASTAKAGNWTPSAAEIPDLAASKITSGTFAAARIPTLNQNTTGNAATATRLQNARTIGLGGSLTGSASFDGSGNITIDSGITRATLTGDPSSTFRADIFGSNQYGIRLIRGITGGGPFTNYSPGLSWSTSDTHGYLALDYNNATARVGAGSGVGLNWSKVLVFDDDTRIVNATPNTRTITAGAGLSGGGSLSANRSLSVNYGTTAGTAAQGNDSRIVNATPNTRTITAGTGLSGGGTLAANRTLSVTYGTTAGTAAQGNDSRIVNATPNSRQIIAGTGLSGGGTLAANRTLSVTYGTTAGTAAQGNDPRLSNSREWTASVVSQAEAEARTSTTPRKWTAERVGQAAWFGFLELWSTITTEWSRGLLSKNNAAEARAELGLGSAATRSVGTSSGDLLEVGNWYLGTDKQQTVAAATGTADLNLADASIFDLTLTGNVTLSVSNATVSAGYTRSIVVRIRQGATARTVTWWGGITWLASTTPAAPGVNKIVEYVLSYDGSSWLGREGAST